MSLSSYLPPFINLDEVEIEEEENEDVTISEPTSFKTENIVNVNNSNLENDDEINQKFQCILESRGLDESDVKQRLQDIPMDRKRVIVNLSLSQQPIQYDVNYYIAFLGVVTQSIQSFHSKQLLQMMKEMCAFLRSREIKYVNEFLYKNGLQLLNCLLAMYNRTHAWKELIDMEILMQIIMCYEAIVDSDVGIQELTNSPHVVNTLCMILDFELMSNHFGVHSSNNNFRLQRSLSLSNLGKNLHILNRRRFTTQLLQQEEDATPILRRVNSTRAVRSKSEVTMEEQRNVLFRLATLRILFLMSVLCYSSDKGFRVILDSLNNFALFKW
jgi:hypothetical protein